MMLGEGRAFLPREQVTEVVPGEKNRAVGFDGARVSGKTGGVAIRPTFVHPGTEVVWYVPPGNVNGIGEFLGVPRVEQFNRFSRSFQLRCPIQFTEWRSVLDIISGDHDSAIGKKPGARIPNQIHGLGKERDAAVY